MVHLDIVIPPGEFCSLGCCQGVSLDHGNDHLPLLSPVDVHQHSDFLCYVGFKEHQLCSLGMFTHLKVSETLALFYYFLL